jgi:hypothetical protein
MQGKWKQSVGKTDNIKNFQILAFYDGDSLIQAT